MKKEWINRTLLVVAVLLLALNLLSSRIERSYAAQRATLRTLPQYKVIVGANRSALEQTLNQYSSQGYEFVSWDGASPLLILKK